MDPIKLCFLLMSDWEKKNYHNLFFFTPNSKKKKNAYFTGLCFCALLIVLIHELVSIYRFSVEMRICKVL